MKKTILSIITLVALALTANAQGSIEYSLYHGTEELGNWGTEKAEIYNVAIHINDASLVGKTIKSITVPINAKADKATEYEAFLTKELKISKGKAVADITSETFTADGKWVKVTFTNPYTVEDGDFYAGYSFKIETLTNAGAHNKAPVILMVGNNPEGFYLATSRTYRKWTNMTTSISGNTPLALGIEGDFKGESCGVAKLNNVIAKDGDPFTVKATIGNYGINDINSITVNYAVGGKNFTNDINLEEPLKCDFYGRTTNISFTVPAGEIAKGVYTGTLSVTKVNGKDNNRTDIAATNTVKVLTIVPVKRPVMEEFTGTWCGYCPRGWVGMRELNKKYPDRFIAISYHNGDPMAVHEGTTSDPYPLNVAGFPAACMDRVHETDAYFGDTNGTPMGIEQLWLERCDIEAPADIRVEGTIDANGKLSVNSYTTFAANLTDAPYRIAYMVTADGLKGEGGSWVQHNYYSGNQGYGPEMDIFTKGGGSVSIEFDDVLIANSPYLGEAGSLPTTTEEGVMLTHQYEFDTAKILNTSGNPIIQDSGKLNVIALIIDTRTGEIMNAAKTKVDATATGINNTHVENNGYSKVKSIYSTDGKRLDSTKKGINILKMEDGSVRKVIIK